MNSDNTMDAAGDLELIESYLQNKLTQEQTILFEERLRNDPAFWEAVELQRRIIIMVKEAGIRNLFPKAGRNSASNKRDQRIGYFEELNAGEERVEAFADFFSSSSVKLQAADISPIGPNFTAIPYEGDSKPPFRIDEASGKVIFPFAKIRPGSKFINFHYQFKIDSDRNAQLLLLGNFNPKELTLIYHREQNRGNLKLRIGAREYPLKINADIAPLYEEDKPA